MASDEVKCVYWKVSVCLKCIFTSRLDHWILVISMLLCLKAQLQDHIFNLKYACVIFSVPWEIHEGLSNIWFTCILLSTNPFFPPTGVRTIQNTMVFVQAVFQSPSPHSPRGGSATKTLFHVCLQYCQPHRLNPFEWMCWEQNSEQKQHDRPLCTCAGLW